MSQIILGIDPGYGRMGWGVVEVELQARRRRLAFEETSKAGNRLPADEKPRRLPSFIAADCLETKSTLPFGERLLAVFNEVSQLIKEYKPQALAVESLFFNTNAKTAILTSHARGVIVLAGVQANLPVFDYTPLQVKQALVGYGRGDKKQVQEMLKFHLNIKVLPKLDDACDALAIALTHGYTNQVLKKPMTNNQ